MRKLIVTDNPHEQLEYTDDGERIVIKSSTGIPYPEWRSYSLTILNPKEAEILAKFIMEGKK